MTDHLLRLARIVAGIAHPACDTPSRVELLDEARQLVAELQAVPAPAPARRTITREEFDAAADSLQNDYPLTYKEMTPYELAAHFSAAWRLTVED